MLPHVSQVSFMLKLFIGGLELLKCDSPYNTSPIVLFI